jgi:hypothetical protein
MTLRTQYDELPHISRPIPDIHFLSIKTMRTGSNYFLGFIRIQHFNIHHRLHLEQELISCSFAGSPVQLSSVPSTAKERCTIQKLQCFVIFFLLYQNYLHNLPKIVLQVVFLGLTFPPLLALLNSLTFLIFLFS